MTPTKGFRFFHKHWLGEDNSPLLHEVTKVRRGVVYYRPVYTEAGRETLGKPACCDVEQFDRYVLRAA